MDPQGKHDQVSLISEHHWPTDETDQSSTTTTTETARQFAPTSMGKPRPERGSRKTSPNLMALESSLASLRTSLGRVVNRLAASGPTSRSWARAAASELDCAAATGSRKMLLTFLGLVLLSLAPSGLVSASGQTRPAAHQRLIEELDQWQLAPNRLLLQLVTNESQPIAESLESNQKGWSLMSPIEWLFGVDPIVSSATNKEANLPNQKRSIPQERRELAAFRRVAQGYLNRATSVADSGRHGASMATDGPAPSLPQSEPHLQSQGAQNRQQTNSAANNDRLPPVRTTTEPTILDEDVTYIDRINGLDLEALRIKMEQQQRQQKAQDDGTSDEDQVDRSGPTCRLNRFDKLIRQHYQNLSRPIMKPDGSFANPFSTWRDANFLDLIKFVLLERDETNVPKNKDELERELPLLRPDFKQETLPNWDTYRATWIGHSTLLIQINGLNILTDPVFSRRASPTQLFGPKRIRDAACEVKSLPKIDIVLISHNHYDHLDTNSVKELNDRFKEDCRWIVPLGLGSFMRSMSVANYVELNWWQKDCYQLTATQLTNSSSNIFDTGRQASTIDSSSSDQLSIYFTPTQHWSNRGMTDINKSLWGSYTVVSSRGDTFFFGGDTGYCSVFKQIGDIFGPFAGAAIPIGAYKPRWFLKSNHVDPDEAVLIHKEIKSKKSISIHHSTFMLSNEHYKEPREWLEQNMIKEKLDEPFISLKHGESTEFPMEAGQRSRAPHTSRL